jgi:transposase
MISSTDTLEQIKNQNELLKKEVITLREQLGWFKRQLFGKKSEKLIPQSAGALCFDFLSHLSPSQEPPKTKTITIKERKKPEKNGQDAITLPEDIPVERTVLDIPEDQKVCQETGKPLVKIGEEVTRKLAHKPGSYFVKEIVRPKYAHPQASSTSGIRTAEIPSGLLSRCLADESFLADILTKKFADHLPPYRISEILQRDNIQISRQILCEWVLRAGKALKPLYEEMKKAILKSENVFMDESPVNMQDPGKGKVRQAYMWVLAGGKNPNQPYKVYHFRTDRKHSNAIEILKEYKGVLHSDKYGAYETIAKNENIIWTPCWAHIRRKFFEAESGDPEFRAWILRKIRYLYMFERVAWSRSEEERLKIRQEKESRIIDEITEAVKTRLRSGKILPKSKFSEALGYYCGLIPYLKNYTKHPCAHIDNNVAERAIRPLAIGRKNWLFVGTEDGGEVAAVAFSLIQTCRGMGINPREYLEDVMRRIMDHPANKLYELLPGNWTKSL